MSQTKVDPNLPSTILDSSSSNWARLNDLNLIADRLISDSIRRLEDRQPAGQAFRQHIVSTRIAW